MSKKVLIILTEWGYWGEELIGPLETFDKAGYEVSFATPTGKKPHALSASMDASFVDIALQKTVTSPEMAEKVRAIQDSDRLDNPINLSEWMPDRPYISSSNYAREIEAYNATLQQIAEQIDTEYDTILIVGGSGALVDLVNNFRVHDLVLAFYGLGKPVAAECYGVSCLAFARDPVERVSIIRGKHVTGHVLEYDYKDGTTFEGSDGTNFNIGPPPFPLEHVLRDATAPGGAYHGNFGKDISVIVDYPFITGRNTPDSYTTGQKVVEVLEEGLRQWGFDDHGR